MTLEEFQTLINIYGANPKRWPQEQREEAQTFLHDNPTHAGPLLTEAGTLDHYLDSYAPQLLTDPAKDRLLNALSHTDILPPQPQHTSQHIPQYIPGRTHWMARPGWPAIAAMLLIAFGAGFIGATWLPTPTQSPQQYAMIESGEYISDDIAWESTADTLGLSEIYEWVDASEL